MNKYIKSLIVCSIVAFIGTTYFTVITHEGVSYSPGISTLDMDTLTYTEVTEIMQERKQTVSAFEFIKISINSIWFWKNVFQVWSIMLAVSFLSFIATDKWVNN